MHTRSSFQGYLNLDLLSNLYYLVVSNFSIGMFDFPCLSISLAKIRFETFQYSYTKYSHLLLRCQWAIRGAIYLVKQFSETANTTKTDNL